jgi:hypothetical protein
MRNSEGIEIKPGQLWKDDSDSMNNGRWRVIGFYDNRVVAVDGQATRQIQRRLPNCTLIESHGADLEAARAAGWCVWVEGMEQPDADLLEVYESWNGVKWSENTIGPHFAGEYTYRYKLKPTQPEKPKYKLFEIEWEGEPVISHRAKIGEMTDGTTLASPVEVGFLTMCNHRIFGYTDNPKWASIAMAMEAAGKSPHYKTEPCDHAGTRRFAIGRLEV